MRDFTLTTFRLLLQELISRGYTFQPFRDFLKAPAPKAIVLRHDVDARKLNSLQTARIEAELGIAGTYYFRMVSQSFDPGVIRQIAALGHEIGYHYEDLAMAARAIKRRVTPSYAEASAGKSDERRGMQRQVTSDERRGRAGMGIESWEELLYDEAIKSFEQNLAKLRQVVPIDTICMHGSPLSRYDNRKIWEKFNYRNYGILGEPYFDVDFSKVLYLTDTGRMWDGERVSIRDKVPDSQIADTNGKRKSVPLRRGLGEDKSNSTIKQFHSTFNIITAAKSGSLPAQIMITVHPQRWDNRILPWIKELIWQRVKNGMKGVVTSLQYS